MSAANIIIPIIIVTVIIVSLILLTRNSDSSSNPTPPPPPPPVDGFKLTSATIASQNINPVPLNTSEVTTKDGEDFVIPGSNQIVNPTFNYIFTTNTNVSDLSTILVVEYILNDPDGNFIEAQGGSSVMTVGGRRITGVNTGIAYSKTRFKTIHTFDLSNITVTSKTFTINIVFFKTLRRTPTKTNLSEVKMYKQ